MIFYYHSMKLYVLLVLIINLVNNKTPNLRNVFERFGRDQSKYEILVKAAQETFYQLYNTTINFANRYDVQINDSIKRIRVYVDEYDPIIPEVEDNTLFEVINGKPKIDNILKELMILDNDTYKNNADLVIFGNKFNVREEFKLLANKIAAGFDNGAVLIYQIQTDSTYQVRYKCFVCNSKCEKEEDVYGAFEIIQEDKNDSKEIVEKSKNWFEKFENVADKTLKVLKSIGSIVSAAVSIVDGCKNIHDKIAPNKTNFSPYLSSFGIILLSSLAIL